MLNALFKCLKDDDYIRRTLKGGIYTDTEITRQITPDAFDQKSELLPTGLVVLEESVRNQTHPYKWAQTLPFCVYLYERREVQSRDSQRAYGAIRPVATRIERKLHCQTIQPEDRLQAAWYIRHVGTIHHAYDDALDCKMMKVSFEVEMDAAGSCC